jgi:hypothetical protein
MSYGNYASSVLVSSNVAYHSHNSSIVGWPISPIAASIFSAIICLLLDELRMTSEHKSAQISTHSPFDFLSEVEV